MEYLGEIFGRCSIEPMSARERSDKWPHRPLCTVVFLSLAAIALVLSSGVVWCQAPKNAAAPLPLFFIVVPGATNVGHRAFQGKDQLWYSIQAPYPADEVLKSITGRLKRLGWVVLKQDWLNPGLPSSLVRGWGYYEDETTHPKTSVRAWGADWKNRSNDILTYMLEYRCPDNQCASTANLHDLRVIAIYIPAKVAKQIKAEVSKERAEHR